MTDYKAIHGRNVLHVASDLDTSEAEGQIWFNTTSSDYKTIVKVAGAWATGNNMNDGQDAMGHCGTQTACMQFGGRAVTTDSESYDGTTWTETNALPANASFNAGFGTTAAAISAGSDPGSTQADTWDGTNWTEAASISTGRQQMHGVGTQTAGFVVGGTGPDKANVEEYNGSTWSEEADLQTARANSNVAGTTTAALAAGGGPGSGKNIVEEWNGTSWAETTDLNTVRANAGGGGAVSTAAIVAAGITTPSEAQTANTEIWDGSSWTEVANVSTTRELLGSGQAGPNTTSIIFGGVAPPSPPSKLTATEEWNHTSTLAAGAWASSNNMNVGRQGAQAGQQGTQTAGLIYGGDNPSPGYIVNAESYDGTSWTETHDLNVGRNNGAGLGTQTAAVLVNGNNAADSNLCEIYDGSSWSETGDLNTDRRQGSGCGTSTAGLATGGYMPS